MKQKFVTLWSNEPLRGNASSCLFKKHIPAGEGVEPSKLGYIARIKRELIISEKLSRADILVF